MRHLHLQPPAPAEPDPVFAAAVAHASTIANTRDPLAAMRAALHAAGVNDLEERHDELIGVADDLRARLNAANAALTPPETACDPAPAPDTPSWAGPQRPPAGRRAA
jgi:hypothetical protein